MRGPRWRGVAAMSAGLVIAGWGCGGGGPSVSGSSAEGKVTGRLFVKGKPATKGEVVFDPSNIERKLEQARTAPVGPDGTYEITTLVGENKVSARGPGLNAFAYEIQSVDVKEGENTFDIQLPVPIPAD